MSRYTSSDGDDWTETPLTVTGLPSGHPFQVQKLAISSEGTLVSVSNEWMQWYELQDFYRSEDGIQWEVLPGDSFVASHRIQELQFGEVDASFCP
jgi:hypothetical protein